MDRALQNLITSFDFTDSRAQIEKLKKIIALTPEKNDTKIQIIKEEIKAGNYQIRSTNIVNKILEHTNTTVAEEIV